MNWMGSNYCSVAARAWALASEQLEVSLLIYMTAPCSLQAPKGKKRVAPAPTAVKKVCPRASAVAWLVGTASRSCSKVMSGN